MGEGGGGPGGGGEGGGGAGGGLRVTDRVTEVAPYSFPALASTRGIEDAAAEAEVTKVESSVWDLAASEAETTRLPACCSRRRLDEADAPRGMQADAEVACSSVGQPGRGKSSFRKRGVE